jgi:hypothetical protein
MAKQKMKLTGDALAFFKKVGSKGGKKRARKYSAKKLREWARMGGRPKKTKKQKSAPVETVAVCAASL